MSEQATDTTPLTLPFDKFWSWVQSHKNCIVRVGTPYSVLMDQDDFHWDVITEDTETQVLQLVRGKNLVGEIVLMANEIAYVHSEPADGEEQLFECIVETPQSREVIYHFVMAHAYDEDVPAAGRRWTH